MPHETLSPPKHPSDQGKRNGGNPPESIRKRRMWHHGYVRPTFLGAPERTGGPVMVTTPAPFMPDLLPLVAEGWEVYLDGRYPTLRHSDGTVVRWAASWFGDHAGEAAELWPELEARLEAIDHGARPIGAPATTGRDLWLRLIPEGVAYPTMTAEAQEFVRATSGQGRIELLRGSPTLAGLHEYDARMAYTAVMRELPTGEPEHVTTSGLSAKLFDLDRYRPARYLVSWSAPEGWEHPGILPSRAEDDRPVWPLAGRGWADGVEVHLAERFGWSVTFHEALVWPGKTNPLDRFGRAVLANTTDKAGPWRHVWRSVVLHTIGAMFGAPRRHTRYGAEAPEGADGVRLVQTPNGVAVQWTETTPALWPETHHPEWSAAIWSRARARLLDAPGAQGEGPRPAGLVRRTPRVGALHVPAEDVVAFRTDAVYLASDPGWGDDGRPGRYVHKRSVDGPMSRPTSMAELLEVRG